MENFFPSNLKFLRTQARKTQSDLAKVLNKNYSTIGKWELGERNPSTLDLFKIADMFNVSERDLVSTDLRFSNTNNNHNIVVGNVLKKYRQSKNMSMYDVVSKMNTAISVDELEEYENNGLDLESDLFKDICGAIGIDPNEAWKEINSTTLYVNLKQSGHENNGLDKIAPDNELALLLSENTNILTDSDKRIIKTIIEERKKEAEKEN